MGGRVVGKGVAADLVDTFIATEFAGGRHQMRLDKITKLEGGCR
jgi:ribose 5-phosphate isomerase B